VVKRKTEGKPSAVRGGGTSPLHSSLRVGCPEKRYGLPMVCHSLRSCSLRTGGIISPVLYWTLSVIRKTSRRLQFCLLNSSKKPSGRLFQIMSIELEFRLWLICGAGAFAKPDAGERLVRWYAGRSGRSPLALVRSAGAARGRRYGCLPKLVKTCHPEGAVFSDRRVSCEPIRDASLRSA
jgi:hypothetical protein